MAHPSPAAPFVLHRTRIGKGTTNKFRIVSQWRDDFFCIVIFYLSIGKTMNDSRLWKFRNKCRTGIGYGAKMFYVAFPILNER